MHFAFEGPWCPSTEKAIRISRLRRILDPLAGALALFGGLVIGPVAAHAELMVTPVIVDFRSDEAPRRDLELFNNGSERLYIVVEPSEIEAPGTGAETRVQNSDPMALGLLATPGRLILEPGQRKFVRIAMLTDAGDRDRIYRVTVKPVVGEVKSPESGLKILVGYDVLVIRRPSQPHAMITATRSGSRLSLKNIGNTNAELFNGRQCDQQRLHCTALPGRRLYAGASWTISIMPNESVDYSMKVQGGVTEQHY